MKSIEMFIQTSERAQFVPICFAVAHFSTSSRVVLLSDNSPEMLWQDHCASFARPPGLCAMRHLVDYIRMLSLLHTCSGIDMSTKATNCAESAESIWC